jgi:hypothetical protein
MSSFYGTPNFWMEFIQSFFQMRSRNLRSYGPSYEMKPAEMRLIPTT